MNMKTHQAELIAYFQKPRPMFFHQSSANSSDIVIKLVDAFNQLKNCIWFSAGQANVFYKMPVNYDLCLLPHDEMVVEFEVLSPDSSILVGHMIEILKKVDNNKIKVTSIIKHKNGWHFYGSYYLIFNGKDIIIDLIDFSIPGSEVASEEQADRDARVILSFLSCINCVNVKQVEHQANRQPGKASTSRKPLYSYWTLEIDKSKNQTLGLPLGGTHASPRIHLRRGHARQYKPGVYCWVQPCLVGKKEAGMVCKDYALKAA